MNVLFFVFEKIMVEKWEEFFNVVKIVIYVGGFFVGVVIFFVVLFYCICQRRQGVKEVIEVVVCVEVECLEMEWFRKEGINFDVFISNVYEYNVKDMV